MAKKGGHIPLRMCIICRKRVPKPALERYVGGLLYAGPVADPGQTAPGRGLYVCVETRCQEAFLRRLVKRQKKGQKV